MTTNSMEQLSEQKSFGRYYTPLPIVENILDLAGYTDHVILKKHVMENSCGDGAFLAEIVQRYCKSAFKEKYSLSELKEDLETYVHGIEIDEKECAKCLEHISAIVADYGITDVKWDVICADTLMVTRFDGKMDFVLGNPPYIRIHNLGKTFDEIKQFTYTQSGMTDLYLVFYEIGLKMLHSTGVLGYITPSSFFNSVAGSFMRKEIVTHRYLKTIVDLKHYQVFDATTYSSIVILEKGRTSTETDYFQFDTKNQIPYFVEKLTPKEYYIADNFYFAPKNKLSLLKSILFNMSHTDIMVKNGYATLADDVFIHDFGFDSPFVIPVLKASKGIWKKIFYPYTKEGKPITEIELSHDEKMYQYLLSQKSVLLKRSAEKDTPWYAFGRRQAINDTYKEKLSVNAIIRDVSDLKLNIAECGTGIYSGLYVTSTTISMDTIKNLLCSQDFIDYVSLLGKYKSGGYYTFSSKDVKMFLDYKISIEN